MSTGRRYPATSSVVPRLLRPGDTHATMLPQLVAGQLHQSADEPHLLLQDPPPRCRLRREPTNDLREILPKSVSGLRLLRFRDERRSVPTVQCDSGTVQAVQRRVRHNALPHRHRLHDRRYQRTQPEAVVQHVVSARGSGDRRRAALQ